MFGRRRYINQQHNLSSNLFKVKTIILSGFLLLIVVGTCNGSIVVYIVEKWFNVDTLYISHAQARN